MKISLNWLEEILNQKINLSLKDLKNLLLELGFEVSNSEEYPSCAGIVVAEILNILPHPNADRLKIVSVRDDKEVQNVVCGAPNLIKGKKVFWAKVGAKLFNGEKIKESVIRGVQSPGMLLSLKELGIGEDHSGLTYLEGEEKCGTQAEKLIDFEDTILDLEITPNRPDCLSHAGIAREVAAALDLEFPFASLSFKEESYPPFTVKIENELDCPRYIARKICGVQIQSSPLKLQQRLFRCGIRAINNIVDITNAILLEIGQPLHAFDADLLEGEKIAVRRAKQNEKILALDGKEYSLDPEILVIADEKKAVAIAGIMGGEDCAVTNQTKNILLESAIFEKRLVRAARKKCGLGSESSYRFERGVSHWSSSMGSLKAAQKISETTKGKNSQFYDTCPKPQATRSWTLKSSQIKKILGVELPNPETEKLLKRLAIPVQSLNKEELEVRSPTWRLDLSSEIDFIEELIRLKGYSTVPSQGNKFQLNLSESQTSSELNQISGFLKDLRKILTSLGFYESYNIGFVSKKDCDSFAENQLIKIENPLAEEQMFLRPNLLAELLKNLKLNLSYQKKDLRFFEIGKVFQKSNGEIKERLHLAGIACGKSQHAWWKSKSNETIDFFWIKGVLENLNALFNGQIQMKETGLEKNEETSFFTQGSLHPSFSFNLNLSKPFEKIGILGMIHPKNLKELGSENQVALFEIDLETLLGAFKSDKKILTVLRTPAIKRDCSIWINEKILWEEIKEEIKNSGGELLETLIPFDIYTDPKFPDQKSISFTLTFRRPQETLKDETANILREKIVERLKLKFGASLRTK
ncbi:MAG: phenylalanine--tRNA ligase subunit beta [Elusimicrobia bacterium]|nr:phenylalanine--tRNA ligase subunit beta [Elusimicrobiota bacterium]